MERLISCDEAQTQTHTRLDSAMAALQRAAALVLSMFSRTQSLLLARLEEKNTKDDCELCKFDTLLHYLLIK